MCEKFERSSSLDDSSEVDRGPQIQSRLEEVELRINESEPKDKKDQDRQPLSREVIQLINLTSPIWIERGKITRCLAHGHPIGKNHVCDPILRELIIPDSLEQIIK